MESLGEDIIYALVNLLIDDYRITNLAYSLSLNRHWRRALLAFPKAFSSCSLTLTNSQWPPLFPQHFQANLSKSNGRISNLFLNSDYFIFCRLMAHFRDLKINTVFLTTDIHPTLEPAHRLAGNTHDTATVEHLSITSRNGVHFAIPSDILSRVAGNSLTLHSITPIPQFVHWTIEHLSLSFDKFSELDAHHMKYFLAYELPRIQPLRTLSIRGASVGMLLLNHADSDPDENNFRLPLLHTVHLDNTSPILLQYFKSPLLRTVAINNYDIELHRPTLCTDVTHLSLQGTMILFREYDNIQASFFSRLTVLEVLDLSGIPHTMFTDAFNEGVFDLFFPRLRALNISRVHHLLGSAIVRFVKARQSSDDVTSLDELVAVDCAIEAQQQHSLASLIPKCHLDIGRSGHNTDLELSF